MTFESAALDQKQRLDLNGGQAQCRLCDSKKTRLLYRLNFARLWRCRDCDVAFLDPAPTPERLVEFYNNPDYHGKSQPNYWRNSFEDYSEDGAGAREYAALLDRVPVIPGGRLLDIGCATGVFLDMARKRGWKVQGAELSAYASAYAREKFGLDVRTGDVAEAGFSAASFDMVTAWDVFEHLADPVAFLREVRKVIKPGGTLFIETIQHTGLINLLGHLIFILSFGKVDWPLYRLYGIHHIYYFSKRSMKRVLERCGFRITDVRMDEYKIERVEDLSPVTRWVMTAVYALQKITGRTTVITVLAQRAS